jgi:nicotinamide phosphoribosyltransferase
MLLPPSSVLDTDGYKFSHWKQYPVDTQHVISYWEPRLGAQWDHVLFFAAAQVYLHEALMPATWEDIEEARAMLPAHFMGNQNIFNFEGWRHICYRHGGRLPVRIRMPKEGTIIPVSNVLMTIENTDPKVPWLTNYLETRLSQMWYPVTVATQSFEARKVVLKWLEKTGDPAGIDFKLHDFGYRGVTCNEQAAIGGLAHLASGFMGTDTTRAVRYARHFYRSVMPAFTIPAGEHSTVTIWGRDFEIDAYRNFLTAYPEGYVAFPIDSYDAYDACANIIGGTLRDEILARKGTLVVRPDSGDPLIVPADLLDILGHPDRFGFTINEKGYKVLPAQLRMIQGDGINPVVPSIDAIYASLAARGWSADNLAFGSGGGLLQNVSRDTERFAVKCCASVRAGVERHVSKTPMTDYTKSSKGGRLSLYQSGDGRIYTALAGGSVCGTDIMHDVFLNGDVLVNDSFDDIRARATTLAHA